MPHVLNPNCTRCLAVKEKLNAWYCNSCTVRVATRRYEEKKEFVNKLKEKPCVDCGIQYPPHIMQFDHVRGVKEKDIAKMALCKASNEAILEEITKCDLVCCNCHADRTHKRRQQLKESKVSIFDRS